MSRDHRKRMKNKQSLITLVQLSSCITVRKRYNSNDSELTQGNSAPKHCRIGETYVQRQF